MIAHWRLVVVLVAMLLQAGLSAVLLMQHHGEPLGAAVAEVCGPAGDSGCDAVNRSSWSQLGPVPVAAVGLVFAVSISLLVLLALFGGPEARQGAATLTLAAVGLALLVDLVLLGVQAFVVRSFCVLCLATYALNAVALAVLLAARRPAAAAMAVVRQGFNGADGRLVLAGWVAGTVLVVAGVAAADVALVARERQRAGGILGGGAPAGDAGDALTQARAEVARLQGILDDPRQLNQYFADKATREFDTAPVHAIDLTSTPAKGPATAPVKVVEFSDFLCPFCKNLAQGFDQWMPQSQGKATIYFKNFPLEKECHPQLNNTVHPGACNLAYGAVCAQEQGKFWAYHDQVFAKAQIGAKPSDVAALAAAAGLDGAAFESCFASSRPRDRVAREVAEGIAAGVDSTPTVFVQGRKLPRIQDFVATVEREAAR